MYFTTITYQLYPRDQSVASSQYAFLGSMIVFDLSAPIKILMQNVFSVNPT